MPEKKTGTQKSAPRKPASQTGGGSPRRDSATAAPTRKIVGLPKISGLRKITAPVLPKPPVPPAPVPAAPATPQSPQKRGGKKPPKSTKTLAEMRAERVDILDATPKKKRPERPIIGINRIQIPGLDAIAPTASAPEAPIPSETAVTLPSVSTIPSIPHDGTPLSSTPTEAPTNITELSGATFDGKHLTLKLGAVITVKDFATLVSLKPFQVIKDLMDIGIFANLNQNIELDAIKKVAEKHGFHAEREKKDKEKGVRPPEPKKAEDPPPPIPTAPEAPKESTLTSRPPIVTIMGHVDHGKTSLLDAIRNARVAAGESGGITQHIGAYSVQHKDSSGKIHNLTFLDTPGHAAFTAMRARGANVTDIVVLVVAANDGLMPQTIEAINHAKAAGVEIIVAINKIDLSAANPDRVKQQLQEHGLTPEDWGGTTICCPVSATKKTGIDHLLEMIELQAEMLELKADTKASMRGIVIEAQVEQGRGPTATIIVREGTLKPGKTFICGNYNGKVKQLVNDHGKPVKSATPGQPVKVVGLGGLPSAGDELVVMKDDKAARELSEERLEKLRKGKLVAPSRKRTTLENLFAQVAEDEKPALRIVLKCDVHGSLEALIASLADLPQQKVSLDILHSAVGPVTESDVVLADASDAIIIGFGVKVENTAAAAAKRDSIQIKLYSIIYELMDQVEEAMSGLLAPENRETVIGHAEVRQVFDLTKGTVAGCYVAEGRILRSARARVLRGTQPMYDGAITTLRRFQDEVKEVRNGLECGIKLGDFDEYEPGDIIECYTLEKVQQKLV